MILNFRHNQFNNFLNSSVCLSAAPLWNDSNIQFSEILDEFNHIMFGPVVVCVLDVIPIRIWHDGSLFSWNAATLMSL